MQPSILLFRKETRSGGQFYLLLNAEGVQKALQSGAQSCLQYGSIYDCQISGDWLERADLVWKQSQTDTRQMALVHLLTEFLYQLQQRAPVAELLAPSLRAFGETDTLRALGGFMLQLSAYLGGSAVHERRCARCGSRDRELAMDAFGLGCADCITAPELHYSHEASAFIRSLALDSPNRLSCTDIQNLVQTSLAVLQQIAGPLTSALTAARMLACAPRAQRRASGALNQRRNM